MNKGKLVIFSAPSGSGKSTLVNYLMEQGLSFGFSISATSRPPRGNEKDGVEYFFFTPEEFSAKIAADEFVEYEEVYPGRFYGTLKSQVEEQNILFDVDVVGGCNLKKYYGERALFIFVQAPSIEVLRSRLVGRGDTAPEEIEKRLAKAEHEMTYSQYADEVIINDNLDTAKAQLMTVIKEFLAK